MQSWVAVGRFLVLDLDNTLWGGVIGDDGISGIRLGQGSGEGEAFTAFQRYVKSLRDRGVLIAVASKNTHEICAAAIREHPEMVLGMEDFACFRANWNNKADNLVEIANYLNLGLDLVVFFDDLPVERELIRQQLPMVAVPEVPTDPALFVDCLSRAAYFETVTLSNEDLRRHEQYLENEKRRAIIGKSRDMSQFLRSLDLKITICDYKEVDLVRITQLINKTNQFNLTTQRYTDADVRAMGEDFSVVVLSARAEDRFGDQGLISVVIAKPSTSGNGLVIDTWLMSCRVLARNIELALMNALVQIACRRGAEFLLGSYTPTAKNKMVEGFYAGLGFERQVSYELPTSETKWWRLDLSKYVLQQVYATVEVAA